MTKNLFIALYYLLVLAFLSCKTNDSANNLTSHNDPQISPTLNRSVKEEFTNWVNSLDKKSKNLQTFVIPTTTNGNSCQNFRSLVKIDPENFANLMTIWQFLVETESEIERDNKFLIDKCQGLSNSLTFQIDKFFFNRSRQISNLFNQSVLPNRETYAPSPSFKCLNLSNYQLFILRNYKAIIAEDLENSPQSKLEVRKVKNTIQNIEELYSLFVVLEHQFERFDGTQHFVMGFAHGTQKSANAENAQAMVKETLNLRDQIEKNSTALAEMLEDWPRISRYFSKQLIKEILSEEIYSKDSAWDFVANERLISEETRKNIRVIGTKIKKLEEEFKRFIGNFLDPKKGIGKGLNGSKFKRYCSKI